jgi:two-component system sensor histidine kinase MprB
MSLRSRLTLAAAAGVALAVVMASLIVFFVVKDELRGQIDQALRERVGEVEILDQGSGFAIRVASPTLGGAGGYVQAVPARGDLLRPPGENIPLPSEGARGVAAGTRNEFFEDTHVAGVHLRVLTTRVAPGFAVQVARPLDEVDRTLNRLAALLVLVSLGGIALATTLGLGVARAVLAPIRRLTAATEHVTETADLSRRIDGESPDELGRLAGSFNTMLAALETSLDAQRQLVADASHELRTPLTSLRTNVEVLERGDDLDEDDRRRLRHDVIAQVDELTALVADIAELARGRGPDAVVEELRADELVEAAVERAQRHAPKVRFRTALEETVVHGVAARLERAVSNLLDNAATWSPPGGLVEVELRGGELSVRDHGPGIAASDLPHVFDRFYRAPSARGRPGSGLGLAIVRQVADEQGGSVVAETAPGGGARFRFRLSGTS